MGKTNPYFLENFLLLFCYLNLFLLEHAEHSLRHNKAAKDIDRGKYNSEEANKLSKRTFRRACSDDCAYNNNG